MSAASEETCKNCLYAVMLVLVILLINTYYVLSLAGVVGPAAAGVGAAGSAGLDRAGSLGSAGLAGAGSLGSKLGFANISDSWANGSNLANKVSVRDDWGSGFAGRRSHKSGLGGFEPPVFWAAGDLASNADQVQEMAGTEDRMAVKGDQHLVLPPIVDSVQGFNSYLKPRVGFSGSNKALNPY